MNTKKYKQGLVTSLTALSTAMLCQTATTYASDIEIYKAPTTGGASLMMVLDVSGSMSGSGPIKKDFGMDCDDTEYREVSTTFNRTIYKFNGTYCSVNANNKGEPNISNATNKANIIKSCEPEQNKSGKVTQFWCPDRLTSLKKSLFTLLNSSNESERLKDTTIVGITQFPKTGVLFAPAVMNDTNRAALLDIVQNIPISNKAFLKDSGTPLAAGYSVGITGLLKSTSSSETACAGFGTYLLTDGAPNETSDSVSSAATRTNIILSGTSISCSGKNDSWDCIQKGASKLIEKAVNKRLGAALASQQGLEIKTAVVGFGKDFSFTDKNDSSQTVPYVAENLLTYNNAWLEGKFKGNALDASQAAVAGKGGWYSAANTADIVESVTNFVNSIKVPIPAITTGTSAIPQDVLNTSVIQPYSYFPQFEPRPSEDFRAWTGNLKKYNVSGGLLIDKSNTALFSSAGVLNKTNEDLWTPNYATGTTLTAEQQGLKALGGLLSRLNLKKTGSTLNRKVFTSNGTTPITVDETYIKTAPKTLGYYLGLLGYKITEAQVSALNNSNPAGVDTLLNLPEVSATELRQIGAVMHSTPVLLTQSGKIVNSTTGNDTTNRDDYVLFGTTQGVLHVVKAGKSDEITTVGNTAGQEVFAFVPQEMLAAQGKAFLDPPQTVVEGGTSNGMNNLYYGVDGAWTAHTEYVYNSTADQFKVYDTPSKYGKQWVYGGLRMGGRSYYALDLTKMAEATDNQPRIKFRINPVTSSVDGFATPSSTAESARYANLAKMGQSWSKPTIANVQWKGKRRLVMLVGGGYDPGYETFNYNQDSVAQNTATGTGAGIGAGVYMFDANTGEFLWSSYDAVKTPAVAGKTLIGDGDHLKYSVVSQIKGVDRDGDGDVDHLYFGDLGGQVFRIDLDGAHNASGTAANYAKQITRIYNGHVANGVSPRFYEMPAFTVYQGTGGLFAVISIGSGNRSTPLLGKKVNTGYIVAGETDALNTTLTNDAIYNIYDKVVTDANPAAVTLPTSPIQSDLYELTSANRELNATTAGTPPANLAANKENSNYKGWYYSFVSPNLASNDTRRAIEKVQGDLIAIDNDLYVSTFDAEGVGTTESCGAGIYGNSRAHRFCMPYGQCLNGDTVANNTLVLGKGLLGITMGPGANGADRRIIAPLGSLPNGNKITGITYGAANKLIPQSWYEKN
ncbi:pilus assembly protein [Acinetobacter tianfuensis]|uniref:Uncharacterized protein n=1 Tax=Acinetobacter tianfuensis TaxID=2419603 RepID=A0A3A8E9U7_9GAMM|nr:PilC/PilY family type IV pilus protein [Acinetobacter tianfuensis]RKG31617.1 hypothetical protein D7V32_07935 [Acinetobacter tianfuensis]